MGDFRHFAEGAGVSAAEAAAAQVLINNRNATLPHGPLEAWRGADIQCFMTFSSLTIGQSADQFG